MTVDAPPLREDVDLACHEPLERVARRLEEEDGPKLRDALAAARKAHRRVREEARLDGACPSETAELRERLVAYVDGVAGSVHPGLTEGLVGADPAGAVLDLLAAAQGASRGAVAGLPRRVTVAHAPGDLDAVDTDGVGRRVGKGLARLVPGRRGEREVALRAVVRRHRALRVAGAEHAWAGDSLRALAAWTARLERAWSGWISVVLPTLTHLGHGGGANGDPDGEEGTREPSWAAVLGAAARLDEQLGELAEAPPFDGARTQAEAALERLRTALASDLGVAGTFLLRARDGRAEPDAPPVLAAWRRWHDQALDRVRLHEGLLGMVETAEGARSRATLRLRADAVAGWRDAAQRSAGELAGLARRLANPPLELRAALAAARREALERIDPVDPLLPTVEVLERAAVRAADGAVASLQRALRALPVDLELHTLPEQGRAPRGPDRDGRRVRLQDIGRQAFDAIRMERIRTAPAEILPVHGAVAVAVEEVRDIVTYGFDAAEAELVSGEDDAPDRAERLAAEGLERAADALETLAEPVDQAVTAVDRRLREELSAGCARLVGRALAERVQGRLLDARTGLSALLRRVGERAGPGLARWTGRVRSGWARLRRSTARVLRFGRSVVGAEPSSPTARTARSLGSFRELAEGLPLVYRRLFGEDPVSDEALLVGREAELADAERRWQRWRDDEGVPLVVTGRPGSGISSFVRVFSERIGHRGTTLLRDLDERFTTETELSEWVSRALDLEVQQTMDGVARAILSAPAGALPDLFAVEGLEHLYLRTAGGTDLVERLLTLMAETEPRIFWMGSMTESAWQLVEKVEPTAVAQVERVALDPLTAEELKEAVIGRHRRSGVSLRFAEPTEGRHLLRRRLRRQGRESRQRILEEDYFDRLHRSARGNLRLALFEWLRSADFDTADGELLIRPLDPVDFSFLDALDLTQNFSLKAFLEHRTLTLEEHDAVFRLPRQESYQIFESLGNRHVLEAVPGSRGLEDRISEVEAGIRYRIRPVLTGAVAAHLASRNIVH